MSIDSCSTITSSQVSEGWMLGVDTGGTFTDFVLLSRQKIRIHKVLSTPEAPEKAILQGIADLGLSLDETEIVHGSTVATNAVLEGKGVSTVYIGNRGFGDLLSIGRQARKELYNLQPQLRAAPVPADFCIETGGRLSAQGKVLEPLSDEDLAHVRQRLQELKPQSVAINLLFSFLDESFEKAIEEIVPEGMFVSRSSRVLPEFKEYERGMATWLNAYVGPLIDGYLQRLGKAVEPASLAVMQSSGLTSAASEAGKRAVNLLLSGPAGGLMGVQFMGRLAGEEKILSFDMGGTSTDVALVDGSVRLTTEGSIGSYPVAVPMVDMHTIGAGGGSIATIDAGGMLRVGPESAGAYPGPACYGKGGLSATVSDANLVLGRLRSDNFLGGQMRLDESAAFAAIDRLSRRMKCTVNEAATGVIRVANEHMTRALRVISVERGIDPRDFSLACFGGAGGLHVCALAESLGMQRAMVPAHAGVLSALGMLVAPRGRHLSRTHTGLLEDFEPKVLEDQLDNLRITAESELAAEGIDPRSTKTEYSVDLRYQGQSYTLSVPWQAMNNLAPAFHRLHQHRFGHSLAMPLELVNLRVAVSAPQNSIKPTEPDAGTGVPFDHVKLVGLDNPVPVFQRDALDVSGCLKGPLLIVEPVSTTYVAPGWDCAVTAGGSLSLQVLEKI